MLKTKIKKAIAIASIASIATATLWTTYAATIGTGSVSGTGAFNNAIIWNDVFPGTATGTVSGILVKAEVLPTLNMALSTSQINLGTLIGGVTASGTLNIEVGTNAASWVKITAKSGSGWLTNTTNNSIQINSLTTDGIAESYKFESTANTNDSTVTGFTTTWNLTALEVNNNTTAHTIYQTNKPEKLDNTNQDLTFKVTTTADAQTPAWKYQDSITFTVTWNF